MEELVKFSYTFSDHVMWGWPIAIYLLLAGISGGALIIALMVRYYKGQTDNTPLYKAAAIVSFVTIALGMVCLVADLHKPLYFWKILIKYNFQSVMSIGVLAISVYIPLSAVVCAYAFEKEIVDFSKKIGKFTALIERVINLLKKVRPQIEALTVIFAVVICAYTGFLISVLVRFPILNTAILPALFVVSGLSAGIAASSIVAAKFFKEDTHSSDMKTLHTVEWPVMAVELMLLGMLFVSLIIGNEFQKSTVDAFSIGWTAELFWFGIIGLGFVVPLVLNFALGKKVAHSHMTFYVGAICSILGVLCLRMFILYAGQLFGV